MSSFLTSQAIGFALQEIGGDIAALEGIGRNRTVNLSGAYSVKVKGLKEFQRDLKRADPAVYRELRKAFKEAGELVREDATSRFSGISPYSASGYRTRVTQKGVRVDQSRRKVTGRRPDYGRLQMEVALDPALSDKQEQAVRLVEQAIDHALDSVNL